MTRISDRVLDTFARWFRSAAGVWQTAIVTLGIVIVEMCDPRLDEHGFWLLYALTVYSGVTQPILAYVGSRAADKADQAASAVDALLARIDGAASDDVALDRSEIELLRAIATKLGVEVEAVSV